MSMAIAVAGCRRELPPEFPLEYPENSGNMIHANAPFEMFDNCVYRLDSQWRSLTGASTFAEFVNRHCTHLVFTMANTLKLGSDDASPFVRLRGLLDQIDKPVVIFGLGVQSQTDDLTGATLPAEAISLMRYLQDRCAVIGVRGDTTRRVLEQICGVTNTKVVGCPSLFSRPAELARVRRALKDGSGRPAFCGTKFRQPLEARLLRNAIRDDVFLVEPSNRRNHQFYVDVSRGHPKSRLPPFLKDYRADHPEWTRSRLENYYQRRYRLFRDTKSWYRFNHESVSFTYGSRFHVNMASVLSGKPALWLTHDARTRELTDFLHLPAVPIETVQDMGAGEIRSLLDYDDFFDHIGGLFDNFNEYLAANGLPSVKRVGI
ncbi:polysaccharide pyruvyl transferase family protein [Planomonospora sp. ID67723]|uniref:polysaccharide pyruvyl transferase family protein n=1 Tax=Planomonospora sp. ID67723 TaxID=2738134 RepID=UPI0018C3EDA4|nr:polysaccharide pyruvyl transferase family protein [Planomonospora sp. ID67723]MBG0827848.1 polysaccharide pyruvyl transferase family protein [Planomonospora sp. ID67723]